MGSPHNIYLVTAALSGVHEDSVGRDADTLPAHYPRQDVVWEELLTLM